MFATNVKSIVKVLVANKVATIVENSLDGTMQTPLLTVQSCIRLVIGNSA